MEIIALRDFVMLNWIHEYRNNFLDTFFRTITHAGSLYVILPAVVVLIVILVYSGKYLEIKLLVITVALSVLLSHGAKLLFKRPRPDIYPSIVPMPIDWSFPSAHTAQISAFCLCVSLFAFRNFPGVFAWLVCVLSFSLISSVGISRMYLQVHYPTDVLAGFILAALVVTFSFMFIKA
jgi:undecaprenyl-diphosphatase